MKTNKNNALDGFQRKMETAIRKYYHEALSDNAKRDWQKRREKLSTGQNCHVKQCKV